MTIAILTWLGLFPFFAQATISDLTSIPNQKACASILDASPSDESFKISPTLHQTLEINHAQESHLVDNHEAAYREVLTETTLDAENQYEIEEHARWTVFENSDLLNEAVRLALSRREKKNPSFDARNFLLSFSQKVTTIEQENFILDTIFEIQLMLGSFNFLSKVDQKLSLAFLAKKLPNLNQVQLDRFISQYENSPDVYQETLQIRLGYQLLKQDPNWIKRVIHTQTNLTPFWRFSLYSRDKRLAPTPDWTIRRKATPANLFVNLIRPVSDSELWEYLASFKAYNYDQRDAYLVLIAPHLNERQLNQIPSHYPSPSTNDQVIQALEAARTHLQESYLFQEKLRKQRNRITRIELDMQEIQFKLDHLQPRPKIFAGTLEFEHLSEDLLEKITEIETTFNPEHRPILQIGHRLVSPAFRAFAKILESHGLDLSPEAITQLTLTFQSRLVESTKNWGSFYDQSYEATFQDTQPNLFTVEVAQLSRSTIAFGIARIIEQFVFAHPPGPIEMADYWVHLLRLVLVDQKLDAAIVIHENERISFPFFEEKEALSLNPNHTTRLPHASQGLQTIALKYAQSPSIKSLEFELAQLKEEKTQLEKAIQTQP